MTKSIPSIVWVSLLLSGCGGIPSKFTINTPDVARFGEHLKDIDATGGAIDYQHGREFEALKQQNRIGLQHLEINGVKGAFTVTAIVRQRGQTTTLAESAFYSAELPRDPKPKAPDKKQFLFDPNGYKKAVASYKAKLKAWEDRQRVQSLSNRFDLSRLDPSTDATITITVTLVQVASDRHWHIRLALIGVDADNKEHTLQQVEGSDYSHPTISAGQTLPTVQMHILATSKTRTAGI